MGFNEVKKQTIKCLESGDVRHEARNNSIEIKNLFLTGEITTEDLVDILKRTRGNEYESSPHHYDKNIPVHIVKTNYAGAAWYIKWYFESPDCIFISVHH